MEAMEIDVPMQEDLFRAAEKGDASLFSSLPEESLCRARSMRNEDGRSLLHVAASSGHPEVVSVLSAADTSVSGVNSKDEEGWAPLHSAASIGNVQIVEILLDRGADVNLTNDGGRTALHYASSKGWLKIAEILIAHGAKINKKDKVGCTPLHRAASTGNSELCELLIEEGAEVDATDKAGQTPLMHAVICQNKQVALLLIRHGADIDVQDKEGFTVLGQASDEFRPTLIDAAKAMLEDVDHFGVTVYHFGVTVLYTIGSHSLKPNAVQGCKHCRASASNNHWINQETTASIVPHFCNTRKQPLSGPTLEQRLAVLATVLFLAVDVYSICSQAS